MEHEQHNAEGTTETVTSSIRQNAIPLAILAAGLMFAVSHYFVETNAVSGARFAVQNAPVSALQEAVLPSEGVELPVTWGNLGKKLVEAGAIDASGMESLYRDRGGMSAEYRTLLTGSSDKKLAITQDNAGYLLNLLWALGLANKNPILEDTTEMMNPGYGGAGNFASTGGWTLAKGNPMSHYNMHSLIALTPDQQKLVDNVSRTIFRPCCGNSVHFPDCNHGMAMLGLLELMASQGVSEKDMYKAALAVNSYWFPDTYLTIATYMQGKGVSWDKVSPKEMLGEKYSSGAGFQNISSQVSAPANSGGSGGCGVDSGAPAVDEHGHQQQSGCGV